MPDLDDFLNKIEPVVSNEPVITEPVITEPVVEPIVTEPVVPVKTNADFAKERIEARDNKLREQNTQYETALNRVAKQLGITVEQLLEKQQVEADKQEAEKKGIDPDTQKRLRELELKNEQSEKRIQDQTFQYNIVDLQKTYSLDRQSLVEFVNTATEMGIDLMSTNLDYKTVYKAINYEKMMQTTIESEKQKWLAEQERKRNQSPSVNINQSKGNSNTPSGKTLNDFLDLIKE